MIHVVTTNCELYIGMQRLEIVKLGAHAIEVTRTIIIGVLEGGRVDLVDKKIIEGSVYVALAGDWHGCDMQVGMFLV